MGGGGGGGRGGGGGGGGGGGAQIVGLVEQGGSGKAGGGAADSQKGFRPPFDAAAYAAGPLSADEKAPLMLYADCGSDPVMPLESRRVFRLMLGVVAGRMAAARAAKAE